MHLGLTADGQLCKPSRVDQQIPTPSSLYMKKQYTFKHLNIAHDLWLAAFTKNSNRNSRLPYYMLHLKVIWAKMRRMIFRKVVFQMIYLHVSSHRKCTLLPQQSAAYCCAIAQESLNWWLPLPPTMMNGGLLLITVPQQRDNGVTIRLILITVSNKCVD